VGILGVCSDGIANASFFSFRVDFGWAVNLFSGKNGVKVVRPAQYPRLEVGCPGRWASEGFPPSFFFFFFFFKTVGVRLTGSPPLPTAAAQESKTELLGRVRFLPVLFHGPPPPPQVGFTGRWALQGVHPRLGGWKRWLTPGGVFGGLSEC